ncbi:TIGR04282 family arsenosugar biosynthesis glycosyltransferase [Sphingomonas sp. LY54]|uniref:TIGR04282 family arsenosugar biosynthesis glycosyltransferase n=1 Tax=Sphingomonas sp. LY54 TaxID=3095343 RepID=UPI002D7693CD|nr:TIGR04282 family arsenosugar biosynthesis glycosyltransferase [Sphingomonas sp. LY54]WRP27901.1 TIGR04282 family arsenosugar biosynthesis glycosyltransferase [Sphingomonas sp. LY54]
MTRIVIFAKAPVAGRVKTRLIPALGAEGAADLAAAMLHATCREALAAGIGPVELCLARHPEWAGDLPEGVEVTDQGEGDLGDRLWRAAQRAGPPLLLIGTDCPALDRHRLRHAAQRLRDHDAVLHPAADGGYALLGLNRLDRSLFAAMPWSTGTVAGETIARIAALGWSLHIGETLRDIDEPADLAHLPPYLLPPKASVG